MNLAHIKHQYFSILTSKTMGALSLLLSANTINAVIGLVTSVLVLRYVENEVIAVIYPLVSILMIVGQFGDLGISNSFIKLGSSTYKTDRAKSLLYFNAAFKLKLMLGLAILVVGIPLAPLISAKLFGAAQYVEWVRLIIVISSLQIISSYAMATLQIEGAFYYLSLLKVIPTFIKLIAIALLVYFSQAHVAEIFWAFVLVPLITFFMAFIKTNKNAILHTKTNKEVMSELFHVSKWVALSVVANSLLGQLDILMTRSMAGVDELARLAGGQKLASIITILSMSAVTVLLPKVSSMTSKQELNYFLRKTLLFVLPFALLSLSLLSLTKYVIPFMLGAKYNTSIDVFNIYMLGNIIGITVTPMGLILYKLNHEPAVALMNLAQVIVFACVGFFFIPTYGAVASAWVFVLVKVVAFLAVYYLIWKEGILFLAKDEK